MASHGENVALFLGWIVMGLGGMSLVILIFGLVMSYGWRTMRAAVGFVELTQAFCELRARKQRG